MTNLATISCCLCGMAITANEFNMCPSCVSSSNSKEDGVLHQNSPKIKGLILHQCRTCERWQHNNSWVRCERESPELLTLCLKKIPGLKKLALSDAAFIWTEPHCRRMKVRLSVRDQEDVLIEFVEENQQCPECNAEFTNQTWRALVQVRQRVEHKKTFYLLEQQIIRDNAHNHCINLEAFKDGMDFYFSQHKHANIFTEWLCSVTPCRTKRSVKLVSADNHSNIANQKLTIAVEMVPLCRLDLLILPKAAGTKLQGRLVLVSQISSVIKLLDPVTLETADLTAERFWRSPFSPVMTANRLVEYVVLDVERRDREGAGTSNGEAPSRTAKYSLADAEVAREKDFGVNDETALTTTHLGHVLQAGDSVLGYDITASNLLSDEHRCALSRDPPDVLLVKPLKGSKGGKRRKRLAVGGGGGGGGGPKRGAAAAAERKQEDAQEREFSEFLEEIEGDEELQQELEKKDHQQQQQQQQEEEGREGAEVEAEEEVGEPESEPSPLAEGSL